MRFQSKFYVITKNKSIVCCLLVFGVNFSRSGSSNHSKYNIRSKCKSHPLQGLIALHVCGAFVCTGRSLPEQ